MIHNLPKAIQQQIHIYLETDNFRAAKELYDRFVKHSSPDNHTTVTHTQNPQLAMEEA